MSLGSTEVIESSSFRICDMHSRAVKEIVKCFPQSVFCVPRRHYTADVCCRRILADDFSVHGIVNALAIGSPGAKVCAPGPKQIPTEAPQFICGSVPRIHHAQ